MGTIFSRRWNTCRSCGVVSFLPQILVLFLLMSVLEDSGYMARVAFGK